MTATPWAASSAASVPSLRTVRRAHHVNTCSDQAAGTSAVSVEATAKRVRRLFNACNKRLDETYDENKDEDISQFTPSLPSFYPSRSARRLKDANKSGASTTKKKNTVDSTPPTTRSKSAKKK